MSAGKGDTPRAVNGEVYRRNFETIFPTDGKNFDYPEGSKTKEQRIAAMIYAENLEQAKLLAISADREDKLRTDLMLAQKLAESAMLESDRLRAQLHKERA
jgi:hypothetical protein